MDEKEPIPLPIWETDCKYCQFRVMEENVIPPNKYERPCEVMLLARLTENGHCSMCRPNTGFGICRTCEHFNMFCNDNGELYCIHPDGPINRRNTMPWVNAGYKTEISSWHFTYFTCDRYNVNQGQYMGKQYLIDLAVMGKIPKNFNPETWEQLEYINGELLEEWEARRLDYECKKQSSTPKRVNKQPEQLTLI